MAQKLTPKQERFIQEYIRSGNASDALRKAGYSPKYANTHVNKMLQNASIKARLDELQEQLRQETEDIATTVTQFWIEMLKNESARTADRLKASELLAKAGGLFITKVENVGDISIEVNITDD